MDQGNTYKWHIGLILISCLTTLILYITIPYTGKLFFSFLLIQLFVLYIYFLFIVLFPGQLGNYSKFKKLVDTRKKECVFCNRILGATEFYMMNKKRTMEEIALVWNEPENKFYCSDCYLDFDIENNLRTPYNGHYQTDLFIED